MLKKKSFIAFYTIISLCCVVGQLLLPVPPLGADDPYLKLGLYQKPLGADDHNKKHHHKPLLGVDDHDLKPHHKPLLGADDHDKKLHHKFQPLLGADDHDLKLHHESLLGADDPDKKRHRELFLGADDHDLKPHHKPLIRSNDYDKKPRHKPLGAGDHDKKPHLKRILGADDHDKKNHRKPVFGADDDHLKPHRKLLLGADNHDKKPHHKPLLGANDHDKKPHRKRIFGADDHDKKPHHKPLLGADDHDKKPHRKPLLGADDDHDLKLHHKSLVGRDDHDLKPHRRLRGRKLLNLPHLEAFKYFVRAFNRSYATHKEFSKRFRLFRNNLRKIAALQQNEMGTAEYGLTKFADWSLFEFQRLLGLKPHLKPSASRLKPAQIPDIEVPVEYDWREKDVVTGIKNQGMCGSCWAFSVTGNVEGQWALKHKKLYSLSEQELVDCDDTDEGCNGGLPENAYKAIEDLGGLETEKAYPYEGRDDKCQLDTTKMKVQVNGSVELPEDEKLMSKWLVQNGPISIGINANALQFYVGGVSHPFKFLCSPDDLNHGMLIVGYGIHTYPIFEKALPYWIVKNSWGENWGEQGYYRVYRGDGTCGVNKMATSAVVP